MSIRKNKPTEPGFRRTLFEIIFEADTGLGKLFDVALIWAILLSVLTVILESVTEIEQVHGSLIRTLEWIFTILFSIEYLLRVYCSRRSSLYVFSFYGIIDLLAVLPTYLSFLVSGSHYLSVIRIVRILRVFRVLKMTRYLGEAEVLKEAISASRHKITVFVGTVLALVTIIGSLMYIVEGEASGFSSIPKSMYWAIVTLTTVGYGDIAPETALGQTLAAIVMILGYGIIAVPTGIVSVEISKASEARHSKAAQDSERTKLQSNIPLNPLESSHSISISEPSSAEQSTTLTHCPHCGRTIA